MYSFVVHIFRKIWTPAKAYRSANFNLEKLDDQIKSQH